MVPADSPLSLSFESERGIVPSGGSFDGRVGGEVVDMAPIDVVRRAMRGDVGCDDNRFGMLGGEEGEVADWNEEDALLVATDDSLARVLSGGRVTLGGDEGVCV
jgi:hypothetical protein